MRSRRVEEQPRCGSEGRTPDEDHRSGYLDVTMMKLWCNDLGSSEYGSVDLSDRKGIG